MKSAVTIVLFLYAITFYVIVTSAWVVFGSPPAPMVSLLVWAASGLIIADLILTVGLFASLALFCLDEPCVIEANRRLALLPPTPTAFRCFQLATQITMVVFLFFAGCEFLAVLQTCVLVLIWHGSISLNCAKREWRNRDAKINGAFRVFKEKA